MTALRHVLAQREEADPATPREESAATRAAVPVVELLDISEHAAALGMQCSARIAPSLADRLDGGVALRRLADALRATVDDPDFDLMRSVVLHGARPAHQPQDFPSLQKFLARARAGVGGVSDHGQMIALAVEGRRGPEMVLFGLWLSFAYVKYSPWLCLVGLDGLGKIGPYDLAWR